MYESGRTMERDNRQIAWTIAYEVLRRSREALDLRMLYPCGEQYKCLTLLRSREKKPLILINILGSSILLAQCDELITPYPEAYKQNFNGLLEQISKYGRVDLSEKPMRDIPAIAFLVECVESGFDIESAWYDGSNSCGLSKEAKDFIHYPLKDERDESAHLVWWLIQSMGKVIAVCNTDTVELILRSGKRYHLLNGEGNEAMIDMTIRSEWEKTIEDTKDLLSTNDEWKKRYAEYADIISGNIKAIQEARRGFREWEPLKFYLNVTNAKSVGNKVRFDVRFLGQSVANLAWTKDSVKLSTLERHVRTNKDFFSYQGAVTEVDWDSIKARSFRGYFKRLQQTKNKGNEEHRVESMILSEMLKIKDKKLRNMAPVTIGGLRFPMPTPLKASNHNTVSYAKQFGGGIDVFARVGTGGRNTNLCIMELKDQNIKQEPPEDAVKQALVYTTFIQKLLRSDAGEIWWKLFGFNGEIPKKLVLFTACVMPMADGMNKRFGDENIELELGCGYNGGCDDIARIHHLYFDDSHNIIDRIETSLKF